MKRVVLLLLILIPTSILSQDRVKKIYFGIETKFIKEIDSNIERSAFLHSEKLGISTRFMVGYIFNKHLSAGAGFGCDGYSTPALLTFPVFVETRLSLKENSTPYLYADLGYSFKYAKTTDKGMVFNAGIGYKIKLKGIYLTPTIGYNYKHVGDWNQHTYESYLSELKRHNLTFGVGIMF
jgi:hypothetical protein